MRDGDSTAADTQRGPSRASVAWGFAAAVALSLTSCGAAEEPRPVAGLAEASSQTGPTGPVVREITTYAGTGSPKFKGDSGPAVEAGMFQPIGVALDRAGNLFISTDNRIRRVDAGTGVITTVAGSGSTMGDRGDGGPALDAKFRLPQGLAVDSAGDLYITDRESLIRKVDMATGIITTVVGGGVGNPRLGEFGDGKLATDALLKLPQDVAVDAAGNVYITTDNRIRMVDGSTGFIDTIAGTGVRGVEGDDGPALNATMAEPRGLELDDAGNILFADSDNHRVRKVDGTTGVVTTVAGIGTHLVRGPMWGTAIGHAQGYRSQRIAAEATGVGYSGDGGPANEAMMTFPLGVALDSAGNMFVAEGGLRVRRVDGASGTITTVVAGESRSESESGKVQVYTGSIREIVSLVVGPDGELFLADYGKNVVHKVSAQ